jgi:hypothetical protein
MICERSTTEKRWRQDGCPQTLEGDQFSKNAQELGKGIPQGTLARKKNSAEAIHNPATSEIWRRLWLYRRLAPQWYAMSCPKGNASGAIKEVGDETNLRRVMLSAGKREKAV